MSDTRRAGGRMHSQTNATASGARELNRRSYDAIAAAWDVSRSGFYGRELDYLDALLEGIPQPARVLDLGCGTGRPFAERVLGLGYRLTGVDQSEAMLMRARNRFPAEAWIHAAIEDYVPTACVSAIICWDTLFHIERRWHEMLLRRFARILPPEGKLMFTVGGSAHPPFTDTMFGERFFYDSHPPQTVRALVARAGLKLIVEEFMNVPTGGRDKGRYAIVAAKEGAAP